MDICSLEDDDYEGLFITQSDKVVQNADVQEKSPIFGDPMDFSAPLVTLTGNCETNQCHYSDISDDDMELIPSSQNIRNSATISSR